MVWLVQEYVRSHFLCTNYFYSCLYIRWLPTFRMGHILSGFLSMNSSILEFSSILHSKVQSDKLSNYIYKASCIRQVSATSSVPISTSFRSPDSLTSLLIDEWPHIYSTHIHLVRNCSYMHLHAFSHWIHISEHFPWFPISHLPPLWWQDNLL